MGIYIYLSEWELKSDKFNKLSSDPLQELFDEARDLDPSLLISEHNCVTKKFFGKQKWASTYTVYHIDKGLFQAREQISGSGDRRIVEAYLYGIINGYNTAKQNGNNPT